MVGLDRVTKKCFIVASIVIIVDALAFRNDNGLPLGNFTSAWYLPNTSMIKQFQGDVFKSYKERGFDTLDVLNYVEYLTKSKTN